MLVAFEGVLVFLFNFLIYKSIIDSLILSFFVILTLYSMRAYDEVNWDIQKQFSRTFASTLLLLLIILALKPLFGWNVEWYQVFSNIVFSFFVLLPIRNIVFKKKRNKVRKYFFVGDEKELNGIVESLKEKYPKFDILFLNPEVLDEIHKVAASSERKNLLIISERYLTTLNGYLGKDNFLPEFIEKELKKVPLKMIELYPKYYMRYFESVKESFLERVLDIVVSIFALIIFSLIMLVVALSIYLEDGRPIIFKQKRVGKNGKLFTMYKFRSMKHVERNRPLFADQEQDRITKVGRVIRKLRFDELPQFYNVLKGDMSIVGPRPEQEKFVKEFEKHITGYKYRHLTKPGITGWAQIMFKYTSSIDETAKKLEYDLWYVKNKSVLIDLKVMAQTLEAMLFKRGAI
ncbi:MAG: exopolysaccharide biosynthesis polyprenyl glycosylphosphotransferase [Thermosipho sp. (in: Bacteria)]|nr:exopolysaccharide biosynthesis polyprenyl glycosylphosphotransferase [Thermosipho sp. (in: thermotogales)]